MEFDGPLTNNRIEMLLSVSRCKTFKQSYHWGVGGQIVLSFATATGNVLNDTLMYSRVHKVRLQPQPYKNESRLEGR
jgi:hypothetical protein